MIPAFQASTMAAHGFPRVSGDDPRAIRAATKAGAFSPRERG